MNEEVKLYQIKPGFAKRNNMLLYFVAKPLVETTKAIYLYGHGSGETTKKGVCCKCGRVLTHPVSVLLGIGPECGGHYHDWNAVGGYTEENLAKLKVLLSNIRIEGWIPKSQIVSVEDTQETVDVPADHPKLQIKTEEVKTDKHCSISVNKYGERVIKIVFKFDYDLVEKVRSLPGRKYHQEDKCWSVPIYVETLNSLIGWGFSIDDELKTFLHKVTKSSTFAETVEIPGLKGELYPFQKAGVAFVERNGGRALIADEMGLGKTMQALGWIHLNATKRPVIIVCPASCKLKWKRDIENWLPDPQIEIISGTSTWEITGNIIVINYDILKEWLPQLLAIHPQVLITDECHYYKSNQAQRTKAVKQLAKGIPHVIALSGTPIVNRPIEAYNAIKIIAPQLFPNPWEYAHRYCGAKHNGFGWDFTGATHTKELHERLTSSIMIRRLKSNVLQDLPPKVYSLVPLPLNNQSDYDLARDNFIQFMRITRGAEAAARASNAEVLTSIEYLKQTAVQGKLSSAIEWIKDFIEVDGKLVVFAVHKFAIDALMTAFGNKAVKIDGSVSMNDRQKAIDRFHTDDSVRLFVGNIRAAGVGIDLWQSSSNVAFLELPWTPGELVQAEDRCHRIGQKDSVTIHYLLATDTIEGHIAELLDRKRKILSAVIDGQEVSQESLLSELIKMYDK